MTKKNEKIMESYQKTKETQVKKRYVRYAEGAEMYSMCETKFQQLAKDAGVGMVLDKKASGKIEKDLWKPQILGC